MTSYSSIVCFVLGSQRDVDKIVGTSKESYPSPDIWCQDLHHS